MGSVRLPGKPTKSINGIPLIDRVYEQCTKAGTGKVYVASDSEEILLRVPQESRLLVTTKCKCGTDRVAMAAMMLGLPDDEIVLNVQGDMPYIPHQLIREFVGFMHFNDHAMGTVAIKCTGGVPPGFVSVVLDKDGNAIYFSRSKIPALEAASYYQHVGMYGFKTEVLKKFINSKESMLEQAEGLEQLRVIENRLCNIGVMMTKTDPGPEINVPEDLETVKKYAGPGEYACGM